MIIKLKRICIKLSATHHNNYVPPNIMFQISFLLFMAMNFSSFLTIQVENDNNIKACPISPNIKANKNGKDIIV